MGMYTSYWKEARCEVCGRNYRRQHQFKMGDDRCDSFSEDARAPKYVHPGEYEAAYSLRCGRCDNFLAEAARCVLRSALGLARDVPSWTVMGEEGAWQALRVTRNSRKKPRVEIMADSSWAGVEVYPRSGRVGQRFAAQVQSDWTGRLAGTGLARWVKMKVSREEEFWNRKIPRSGKKITRLQVASPGWQEGILVVRKDRRVAAVKEKKR